MLHNQNTTSSTDNTPPPGVGLTFIPSTTISPCVLASLVGMIRFLRLIAAFRFRSWVVPQSGHVHLGSRFSFAFTVPHTWQVRLLGNHTEARTTLVWRHWPL